MAAAAVAPAEIGPFTGTSRAIHRLTSSDVEDEADGNTRWEEDHNLMSSAPPLDTVGLLE